MSFLHTVLYFIEKGFIVTNFTLPRLFRCEQWERNLSFGSADVRGAGTRDKPLRMSAWEAINNLI